MLGGRNESDLGRIARDALRQLTSGGVELRYAGAAQDRYGHVLAQIFAKEMWVQGELLRRGLARVHGRADNRTGLAAMLAIEAEARQAKRSLWARPYYGVREADAIGRDAGRFLIVEGSVAQATAVSGGLYVNFGADWHSAFSLHLDSAAVKLCRAAGLDPTKLAGAHLRVRGFVEGGRRPLMEVTFPEQIERLD
jgi:micrococcal nuclease